MSTTMPLQAIEVPDHLLEALRLTAARHISNMCVELGDSFPGYESDNGARAEFAASYSALTRAIDVFEQLRTDKKPRTVVVDRGTLLPLLRDAADGTSHHVQSLVEQGITDTARADEIVKWTTISRDLMAMIERESAVASC